MGAAKPVFGSGLVFGEKLEEKAVVPDKPVTQVGGEGCSPRQTNFLMGALKKHAF